MIRSAALLAIILLGTLPASAQLYPTPAGRDANAAADAAPQPAPGDPAQQDAPVVTPVVSAELSAESVLVGQPIVLRIKVLVPTWMPQPPVIPALDMPNVIVRLPERSTGPISETVGGETWSGVGRSYRLYPMVPGALALPGAEITVTFADPDTSQPVTYIAPLDPILIRATIPDAAEGLDPLIIAEGFTLEQEIDAPEGVLGQGDAASRKVTARITGTSPLFIPELIPATGDEAFALRAYPKDPKVEESEDRGVLSGSRTEEVSYVAQHGGEVELAAISIDWFNIATGAVETALLDGMTVVVDAPAPPNEPSLTPRQIAVLLSGLALAVMLALVVRKRVLQALEAWRDRRRVVWAESEACAARDVRRAIGNRDLAATHSALGTWSERCPGEDLSGIDAALAIIGAGTYRQGSGGTDGWTGLSAAFRRERDRRLAGNRAARSALPPLNP